jgi:hypothetical protein
MSFAKFSFLAIGLGVLVLGGCLGEYMASGGNSNLPKDSVGDQDSARYEDSIQYQHSSDVCLAPGRWFVDTIPEINHAATFSIFQDERHPTDASMGPSGYTDAIGGVFSPVPRAVRIVLVSHYTEPAMLNWLADGFFESDSSTWIPWYTREGTLVHEFTLADSILSAGTYPLSLVDTAGALHVNVYLYNFNATEIHSLALTELKGSVTVAETFTKESGQLSYSLEVSYLPGQKTRFQGTVTYGGLEYRRSCVRPWPWPWR